MATDYVKRFLLSGDSEKTTHSIRMGPVLMLGSVRGIAESFSTSRELTHVWLFSCVRPKMCFQVLKPAVGFGASFKLQSITL